jgi:hypothetical protein
MSFPMRAVGPISLVFLAAPAESAVLADLRLPRRTPAPLFPTKGVAQSLDAAFKAWPALNNETTRRTVNAGRRFRLHLDTNASRVVDPTVELFHGDSLMSRFAMAVATRRCIDRKEFFEACEFFAQVQGTLVADDGLLIDVAGGHGLVGTLVALFKSKDFERVIIRDPRRPKAFDEVVSAAVEVAPWVSGRITYEQKKILPSDPLPRGGAAVVCVHGCKSLTDRIIAAAAEAEARSIALMPCCYPSDAAQAPTALVQSLGTPLASDVQRTYDLQMHGYEVRWKAIPQSITPMNRILLASRTSTSLASPAVASLAVASPASAPVMDLAAPVVPPPMPPRVDAAAPKSPMNARRNRVSSDFRPDALGGGSTEGTRW